jgi:hypothetical protein
MWLALRRGRRHLVIECLEKLSQRFGGNQAFVKFLMNRAFSQMSLTRRRYRLPGVRSLHFNDSSLLEKFINYKETGSSNN